MLHNQRPKSVRYGRTGKAELIDEEAEAVTELWVRRIGGCRLVRLRQSGESASAKMDRGKC